MATAKKKRSSATSRRNQTFSVAGVSIGDGHPSFIIAEVANCHEGDFTVAKKMVDAIIPAGVSAVKFQLHIVEDEMTHDHPKFETQRRRSLSVPELKKLKRYVESKGLIFLCSPFSRMAIDELDRMDIAAYKIGSGEISDPLFIEYVAKKRRPVIFSTGMTTVAEIDAAVAILKKYRTPFAIMHCVSQYPAEHHNLYLKTIPFLKKRYGVPVGLSDHTTDAYSAYAATALGKNMLEKHYTLDRTTEGTSDHKVSLEPDEWIEMVEGVRAIERAMGEPQPGILDIEQGTVRWARHSIVAKRPLRKGEKITLKDITTKRPLYDAIPAKDWKKVIGKRVRRDIPADSRLTKGDIG